VTVHPSRQRIGRFRRAGSTSTRALQSGKIFTHLQQLKNKRIILVTTQPLADGGWVDTQEDVTEKTLAQERIAWLARHCPLTELANRAYLRDRLGEMMASLDPGKLLAVHLIDLDYFKQVNDTLGHAAGDAVLKAVAGRMRSALRDHDFVGRLGGDEFAIIQSGITDQEQAFHLARRLVKDLGAPYRTSGERVRIGASIGIAIYPRHGDDTDTLLQNADEALYRVKMRGRGSFAVYESTNEALRDREGRSLSRLHGLSRRLRSIAATLQQTFKIR
jgi:diguanylate cyclase (GGDEF)-like protein